MEPLASHGDLKPGTLDLGTGTWPWDLGPGTWNDHTTWEESQAGVSGRSLFLAGWSLFLAGKRLFLVGLFLASCGCQVVGGRCTV